jgi:hypothetical protein
MQKNLKKELLELSKSVDDYFKIKTTSSIDPALELSGDVELPYYFTCEALHPGNYQGYEIEEQDIYRAKDTIFESQDNYHNYEINLDHKNSRKLDSSVRDLVGKVVETMYDFNKQAYIVKGAVYDKSVALKIANKIIKYVSLRINPTRIEEKDNKVYARDLKFEEISFVRVPGDSQVKIY